ncbi:MAG TPA: hypothetical protein VM324_01360 [Egibacteraceae bacterium]|nr:hypothetical protein [Egibacteraceae bacterium]
MPRTVRLASLAMLAAGLLVGLAAPALAHGRGTDASNYLSRVTAAPTIEGLRWRVYGGDELLWVENRTGDELIVYGYEREPRDLYLRIGPDGVFENRNAAATYLNRERLGGPVPEGIDAEAPPDWVQVSTEPRFMWHDHRIHYMGVGLHPRVTDPAERTPIMEWSVPFSLAGEELEVAGELEWVPGPPWWPWPLVGLALTLPALLGLRTGPHGDRWPGLARPAALVLGAVAATNLVFLVDDLLAVPLPLATRVPAAVQTALFIGLAAFGALRGRRGGDAGAFTALGVGAGALLIGQGLLLLPALAASQLSTVFPDAVPRLVMGLNIAQVLPLGAVAFVGTRRVLPADAGPRDEPAAVGG